MPHLNSDRSRSARRRKNSPAELSWTLDLWHDARVKTPRKAKKVAPKRARRDRVDQVGRALLQHRRRDDLLARRLQVARQPDPRGAAGDVRRPARFAPGRRQDGSASQAAHARRSAARARAPVGADGRGARAEKGVLTNIGAVLAGAASATARLSTDRSRSASRTTPRQMLPSRD